MFRKQKPNLCLKIESRSTEAREANDDETS